jgi:hypothetical protein
MACVERCMDGWVTVVDPLLRLATRLIGFYTRKCSTFALTCLGAVQPHPLLSWADHPPGSDINRVPVLKPQGICCSRQWTAQLIIRESAEVWDKSHEHNSCSTPSSPPEILNMCQTSLWAQAWPRSCPSLCLLGRLVRNHTGLMSGHMPCLRVGIEACLTPPLMAHHARLEECHKRAMPT